MGILILCARCKHQEVMETLLNVPPQNMHTVSPGNSAANDRTLCDTCIGEYRRIEAEEEIEVAKKLLHWIEHGEAK